MDCIDRGVSWLHEAERGEIHDELFAVIGLEGFLELQVVLPAYDLFSVPYLEYLMKQVPHVSFVLPTQVSGDPFDDLERHL